MRAQLQWLAILGTGLIVVAGLVWSGAEDFAAGRPTADPVEVPAGGVAWVPMQDGLALAAAEEKKILIDVYTDWCTWCKVMDEETYARPAIVEFVNAHFVAVKLNGEGTREIRIWDGQFTEQEIAARLGTRGYPNTVFLAADLEPIGSQSGFVKAETFLPLLKFVQRNLVGKMDFQAFLQQETGG